MLFLLPMRGRTPENIPLKLDSGRAPRCTVCCSYYSVNPVASFIWKPFFFLPFNSPYVPSLVVQKFSPSLWDAHKSSLRFLQSRPLSSAHPSRFPPPLFPTPAPLSRAEFPPLRDSSRVLALSHFSYDLSFFPAPLYAYLYPHLSIGLRSARFLRTRPRPSMSETTLIGFHDLS